MPDCDELVADCRVRTGTDLLAHRWDPVALAALRPGPCRRAALRDAIGGISDKALTETLRRLRDAGLVERRAYAEAPPRVEYGLTALGASLVDGPLAALGRWAAEHGDELLAAREAAAAAQARGAGTSRSPSTWASDEQPHIASDRSRSASSERTTSRTPS